MIFTKLASNTTIMIILDPNIIILIIINAIFTRMLMGMTVKYFDGCEVYKQIKNKIIF